MRLIKDRSQEMLQGGAPLSISIGLGFIGRKSMRRRFGAGVVCPNSGEKLIFPENLCYSSSQGQAYHG
jgi:hypothetical protein